jgi:hypothetical protein
MIGNCKQSRTSICWFTLIFLLSIFGCNEDRVPIPKSELDKPPVISVGAFASDGSGQIQYPNVSPTICASPCKNSVTLTNVNDTADVTLFISASNPGGVQYLNVVVSQNGPLYEVSRSDAPDANNLVATSLSIDGTNKTGGIGSIPLLIHLNKVKTSATVLVTAGNYNTPPQQPSVYAVTYYMKNHVTANLSVSKSTIYTDETTTLTWATTHAESIAITAALPQTPMPQAPPTQLNGSSDVGPFRQAGPGTYTYTLTARDWLESATSSKTVTVNERPHLGGDIAVTFRFTCPGDAANAYLNIQGDCISTPCSSPSISSSAAFSNEYPGLLIQCSGGAGSIFHSYPNLQSGTWKVTVTSNVSVSYGNIQRTDDCQTDVKAGEHHSVLFDYAWDSSTRTWNYACTAN